MEQDSDLWFSESKVYKILKMFKICHWNIILRTAAGFAKSALTFDPLRHYAEINSGIKYPSQRTQKQEQHFDHSVDIPLAEKSNIFKSVHQFKNLLWNYCTFLAGSSFVDAGLFFALGRGFTGLSSASSSESKSSSFISEMEANFSAKSF